MCVHHGDHAIMGGLDDLPACQFKDRLQGILQGIYSSVLALLDW